jgi:steroid delta-isomerase-like uncharacterized protein
MMVSTGHEAEHAANIRTPMEVAQEKWAALAAHDLETVAGLYRDDVVADFVPVGVLTGKAAVLDYLSALLQAIPDVRFIVDELTADERKAVVEWRMRGTFTGRPLPVLNIAATGRPIEVRGVDLEEVSEGLLVRVTSYSDGLGLARQIGMLPAVDSVLERAMVGGFNGLQRLRRRLKGLERTADG